MQNRLIVLTHHKCASTWLGTYLDDIQQINSLLISKTHYSNALLNQNADIWSITNASYDFIRDKISTGVHIIRNPLNILASAYYSHKNTHPLEGWPELSKQREVLNSVSKKEGILLTLSFLERDDFYSGAVGPLHALRHWDFDDARFETIRMEDMVSNPGDVVGKVLRSHFPAVRLPGSENYTFESFTGRKVGALDDSSHYRSGRSDQWKEELPQAAITYIRAHYRELLERYYPETL